MGSKKDGKLTKRKEKPKTKPKTKRPVYCVCRREWDGNSLMVQCDHCQEWFHPKCVGVSTKEAKDNPFICPQCQDKPILKLINYKMESYKKDMQFSYFEHKDPKRLLQLYAIIDPHHKHNKHSAPNHNPQSSQLQPIIDSNVLHQIKNNAANPHQFYNEIILFATQKKNKIEIKHIETINECKKYIYSCLFGKHLDLISNKNRNKIIKHRSDGHKRNDFHTLLCVNCNGEIPTNCYNQHIDKCAQFNYNNNDMESGEDFDLDLSFEDILFSTNYKSICIPHNPYQIAMSERNENENEMNMLAPIDINDRDKVIKQLIDKESKYKTYGNSDNSNVLLTHTNHKNLQIFYKIYKKLMSELSQQLSDEEEEEDEEDEDDDIPIAQNLKQNDYKSKYKKIENKFKKYKHLQKIKNLQEKQKKYKLNQNVNDKLINKCQLKYKKDKNVLNKLYKNIFPLTANPKNAKQLLNKLRFCNLNNLKLRHCAYLFDKNNVKIKNENENEEKTMRMDVDNGNNNKNINSNDNDNDNDCNNINEYEYSYFCDNKLNKNGLCSIHKNWRIESYKKLSENLQNEIKQIFLLKCLLKEINNKKMVEMLEKEQEMDFNKVYNNDINLFDDKDINMKPSISISIDSKKTDIDFLMKTKLNNNNNADITQSTLQKIENNAVSYPLQ